MTRPTHALDGAGDGLRAVDDPPHVAGLFSAAPPQRDLQALGGPVLRDKVRDIVGLYMDPPQHPWFSVWIFSCRSHDWILFCMIE